MEVILGLRKGNEIPTLSCMGFALKFNSCKCAIQTRITQNASKSLMCLSYVICNAICTPQFRSQQQNKIQYIRIELTRV